MKKNKSKSPITKTQKRITTEGNTSNSYNYVMTSRNSKTKPFRNSVNLTKMSFKKTK